MKYIYNGFRVLLGIVFLAGFLAYLELSLFKGAASPLNWKHFLIAGGIAAVIAACWYEERNGKSSLLRRPGPSIGKAPRIKTRSDGTVVHHYDDGTKIVWKDGKVVKFECADAPTNTLFGD